jgi:hypothetical protein
MRIICENILSEMFVSIEDLPLDIDQIEVVPRGEEMYMGKVRDI